MKNKIAIALPLTLALTACGAGRDSAGPAGAPEPDNPQMVFVDLDGCRWWVIGNATDRTWAPQTDVNGQQICDPAGAAEGRPIEPVFNAETAAPTSIVPFDAPTTGEAISSEPLAAATVEPAPAPTAPVASGSGTSFVVQVATFAAQVNAIAASENFAAQGLPVGSDPSRASGDGFYRLELGPFSSSDQAENALLRARAEGFSDAFVRRR